MLNTKIKTAYGMPLLENMEFKTLGGATVTVKFAYSFEEMGFHWCPLFHIMATAEIVDKGDWTLSQFNQTIAIPPEAKCPAEIIKNAQTECVTKFMNEILHSGVR